MGALTAAQRDALAAVFDRGEVAAAFEKLGEFADLRQNDLPQLDKKTLARLGADASAARAFAAGLVSPSATVRRMARKYAPKLLPHGPGEILRLLAECVRPFRKLAKGEVGLAGSFEGYATPLGPAVLGAELSFAVKNPAVQVYSEATKLMKECLENLAGAAALCPAGTLVRSFEIVQAIVRPYNYLDPATVPSDVPLDESVYRGGFPASVLGPELKAAFYPLARKGDPAFLAAVERWSAGQLVLEDPAPDGSAEAAVASRFRELSPAERAVARVVLVVAAGDLALHVLPPEQASALATRIRAYRSDVAGFERLQKLILGRHPVAPADAASPSPLPPLAPEGAAALLAPIGGPSAGDSGRPAPGKAGAKKASAPDKTARAPKATPSEPAPGAARVASAEERPGPLDAWPGPDSTDVANRMLELSKRLGIASVWDRIRTVRKHSWEKDPPAPVPGAPADGEAVLTQAWDGLAGAMIPGPERVRVLAALKGSSFGHDESYVPEAALDGPWADRLAAIVAGLDAPPGVRVRAALTLLPARLVERHAAAWREAVLAMDAQELDLARHGVADLVVARGPIVLLPALEPLVVRVSADRPYRVDEWDVAVALLGDRASGRAAATRLVAACRLPGDEKQYYARHCFKAAYRYAFRRAWDRRDADFLGAAFARLVVPIYWKGKRAMIPAEERFALDSYAPREGTAPTAAETSLAEVLAFVARERPARLAEGLAAAGAVASVEKGARAILDAAAALPEARAAVEKGLGEVVAILEAPQDSAVREALEMLVSSATLLGERLDDVLRGVERAVASASPGVVQAAAKLLGAIAVEHPSRCPDALRLLEECLESRNIPTAEDALRAVAKALGTAAEATTKERTAKSAKDAKNGKKDEKGKGKAGKPAKSAKGESSVAGGAKVALSAAARARVEALAAEEPKRLGKLAAAVLAAGR